MVAEVPNGLPMRFQPSSCAPVVLCSEPNSNWYDYSGNDPRHSPLWVRPESLCPNNLYDGTSVKHSLKCEKILRQNVLENFDFGDLSDLFLTIFNIF